MGDAAVDAVASVDRTLIGPDRAGMIGTAGTAVLLTATWFWLPFVNGGRAPFAVTAIGLLALPALPVIQRAVARTDRRIRYLIAWYGLGLIVVSLTAGYRDALLTTTITYALVPLVYLAVRAVTTSAVAQHLPAIVSAAGVVLWSRGIAGWIRGDADFTAWRVVNWHNPSAALLGAFGLYALSQAVLRDRHVPLHTAAASLCLSGVWLTGSRSGTAFTATALVLLLATSVRDRRSAATVGLIGVLATVLTVGLLVTNSSYGRGPSSTGGGVSASPLDARGADGGRNLRLRVLHVEAALRVFSDHPWVGTGPGSYGVAAMRVARPEMNYTSSAHDEPAEVLAEGGLAFGLPFGVGFVVTAAVALHTLVRRRDRSGAAAAVLVLLGHAAFDVGWWYLIVPLVTASFAALLVPVAALAPSTRWRGGFATATIAAPVLVATMLVIAYGATDTPPPWGSRAPADTAVEALRAGDIPAAREAALEARAAAPGDPDLVVLEALTSGSVPPPPGSPRAEGFVVAALVGAGDGRAPAALAALEQRLDGLHPSQWATTRDLVASLREQLASRAST